MSKEAPPELLNSQREELETIALLQETQKALKAKNLPEHLQDTLNERVGMCHQRLKQLRGEQIGILMIHNSDSDGVVKMYDHYIANGGNPTNVKQGMALANRHQKNRDIATGEHDRKLEQGRAAWDALSTSEQRERLDNQRRIREGMGLESQHHGENNPYSMAHNPGHRGHSAG
jgi:hypothetical protein